MPAGSRTFAIGEYSGEDDDDPNVATRDRRAPPQGSTASRWWGTSDAVPHTHLRAHETVLEFVCRLLLEKKKK